MALTFTLRLNIVSIGPYRKGFAAGIWQPVETVHPGCGRPWRSNTALRSLSESPRFASVAGLAFDRHASASPAEQLYQRAARDSLLGGSPSQFLHLALVLLVPASPRHRRPGGACGQAPGWGWREQCGQQSGELFEAVILVLQLGAVPVGANGKHPFLAQTRAQPLLKPPSLTFIED